MLDFSALSFFNYSKLQVSQESLSLDRRLDEGSEECDQICFQTFINGIVDYLESEHKNVRDKYFSLFEILQYAYFYVNTIYDQENRNFQ